MKEVMLLAAGYSTRLYPLTKQIPKPMLPFWNQRILDMTLHYLSKFNVRKVAVNMHHAQEVFLSKLREISTMTILPYQEQHLLGTGGGIKNMKDFITGKTFVVVNCDFLSDIDLSEAIRFHESRKALATMVLVSTANTKKYGEIGINEEQRIVQFPYGQLTEESKDTGVFSGIHIFDQDIFKFMPHQSQFCISRDVYAPLITKQFPVYGYLANVPWHDLGEIELYMISQFALLRQSPSWLHKTLDNYVRLEHGGYISKKTNLDSVINPVDTVLICDHATIERNVKVGPNVIIGSSAVVKSGSVLTNTIVFPHVTIPSNSNMANAIVTQEGILSSPFQ